MAVLTNFLAAHVSAAYPTTNFGSQTRLGLRTGGLGDAIAYINIQQPFPRLATIQSAKIVFYTAAMTTGTHTFTFQRLNQSFSTSKVTYNTRPTSLISGTKTVQKTGVLAEAVEWELDIADWMQTVANGGVWHGLRILENESTVRWIYSETHPSSQYRPRLEITWTAVPETPSGLSPSGGRAVGLAKPVVKTVYRDASGSTQLANIQVQINATDSWGAPSFDSGTVPTSVPELDLSRTDMPGGVYAGLADGSTTFWRVRLQDAAGQWSPYSAAASFKRDDKGTLSVNNPPLGSPAQGTSTNTGHINAILGALTPAVGSTPPVWQSVTQQTRGTGTSSACTYPASIGANDILLWQQYIEPDTRTVTPPDGTWIKLLQTDSNDDQFNLQWYYKRAAGGETGTVTFTHTSSFRSASLHRISGAVTSGNPFEELVSAGTVGSFTLSPVVGLSSPTDRLMVWGSANFQGVGNTWTSPTGYTERLDHSETTLATKLGAVSSPLIEDATPPIAWLFSGETQAAYQIQITHLAGNAIITDWDTGKITSTATSVTVPAGAINEPSSTTYTVTVRIWDTEQREATPGSPTYVEVVRTFTFVPGATTGTTALTAVPQDPRPKVVLTWTSATFPDRFNVLRNGKVIAAAIDPVDTFVSGTTHTYTDQSPSPGRTLTYQVQRVVNNIASATNSTADCTVRSTGIWLREPVAGLELFISGDDDRDFTFGKQSGALTSIAQNANTVLINQSLGGLTAPIEGQLISIYGKTAQEWRDQYIQMRNLRVKRFWLTVGDYTWEVVCDFDNYGRRGIPENVFKVGFVAYQQTSINSILLGS